MSLVTAGMPPRKHNLEDEDEINSGSPTSVKIANDKIKIVKPKAEKKSKSEKLKKEKLESKKTDALPTTGKDSKVRAIALQGDEAMELIISYLKVQNRPYSSTEISANLHGKVAKPVADKLLKEMSDSGKIKSNSTKGNEKGSQWVFWALQDARDNASSEELSQMDKRIQELKETIYNLKIHLKADNKSLENVRSAPTTEELKANIETLHAENMLKIGRLEEYKKGQTTMLTRDEVLKVEKEFKYWNVKRAARKRSFQNLEDLLLESKSQEELWDEVGIEEDSYLLR